MLACPSLWDFTLNLKIFTEQKKQILLSVNNHSHHIAPTSGCTYSDPFHSESAACSTTKHNANKLDKTKLYNI